MDQVAIVLSLISLIIAAFSLGWNIYRDIILKPRAKVSVSKATLVSEVITPQDKLMISAVNFGPGKIRLGIIRFMHRTILARLRRNWTHGVIIHDYKNPLSGQLPVTLDVGESVDLVFPWDKENLCSRAPTHIGIRDSFGRTHWAPISYVQKVNKQWVKEFGETQA